MSSNEQILAITQLASPGGTYQHHQKLVVRKTDDQRVAAQLTQPLVAHVHLTHHAPQATRTANSSGSLAKFGAMRRASSLWPHVHPVALELPQAFRLRVSRRPETA